MNSHIRAFEASSLPTDQGMPEKAAWEKFTKDQLEKSAELQEISDNRLWVKSLERLAETTPALAEMLAKRKGLVSGPLKKAHVKPDFAAKHFVRQLTSLKETKEDRIRRLIPKLSPSVLHLNFKPGPLPNYELKSWIDDLWDACTHDVSSPFYYPQWVGAPDGCPYDEGAWWWTWAIGGTEKVDFLAYFLGRGGSQERACANQARFWWYFIAENTERLQTWINFGLAGPCAYRLNDGDVALWIIPSVEVKEGWSSHWDELETVFLQDRWLHTWLATYGGAVVDGDVPQGPLSLSFQPTPSTYFPLDVTQGRRYIISVDVRVALLTTYDAVIMLGSWAGSTLDLCSIQGDCVLCRCAG